MSWPKAKLYELGFFMLPWLRCLLIVINFFLHSNVKQDGLVKSQNTRIMTL